MKLTAKVSEMLRMTKEGVRRLRGNDEIILWHITPNQEAVESIFRDGFRPPVNEGLMAEDQPWMPKEFLGQQGEDRVSLGLPGLWMVPWIIMKGLADQSGPVLEVRVPRRLLLEKATIARTHVVLGTSYGTRIELPFLTSVEVNLKREVLNSLLEQGRVWVRTDIPDIRDWKEWLRLTLNGEQGLLGMAERRRREMIKEVKKHAGLIILGKTLESTRPTLAASEVPAGLRWSMRSLLLYMKWWAARQELSPNEDCNRAAMQELLRQLGQPVGWLEEAAAAGIREGARVEDRKPAPMFSFNLDIRLPELDLPKLEDLAKTLQQMGH